MRYSEEYELAFLEVDEAAFITTLLISGLDARLLSGELRFAAALGEAHALAEELKDFRRHLTSAGRASYQARVGKHDDLVLAVAIALWWAIERRRHQPTSGP